jgi:DNA primase
MDFAGCATQELTVSSGSSLDAKELVRQAIDIVDLVGSTVQLRRQGRNYVGLCPWHDDSRPSLQVNPQRQSFKCWVCDIGGDIFSFVMKMEGVEFPEALAMLADRAGIVLKPAASQHASGAPGGNATDKRTLYQAMAWAEKQYHECLLHSTEAEAARRYLSERGITAESIEKFHLGFSPLERDWILRRAEGKEGGSQRARILETIGLLARPASGGGLYDRFRARVLFSIRDTQARPVGLGGRVLPELGTTSPAKYVNSPETPLFSKSHLLYGLDVARDAMRKSGMALVMEGYTDVIVAHQYGFHEAVAVLGTALGESHIRILKRFVDRIVLVLDGDEAGQKRSNEVLELFVAQQVDLRILTLPEGLDPCDFLHKFGAAAFAELLANQAVDALDHAFRTATAGLDVDRDVHGASQALERLVAIVAKGPRLRPDTTHEDRFREGKILQRLAARFRVDEQEVRGRLTALRRQARSRPVAAPRENEPAATDTPPAESLSACWRELMELIVGHPECLPQVRDAIRPAWLPGGPCRQIYETCCRLADAGIAPSFDRLLLELDEPQLKNLLVEFDEASQIKESRTGELPTLLQELIRNLQQQEANRERPAQIVALREGGLDASQEIELLQKIIQQERSRQGISGPTDGSGCP